MLHNTITVLGGVIKNRKGGYPCLDRRATRTQENLERITGISFPWTSRKKKSSQKTDNDKQVRGLDPTRKDASFSGNLILGYDLDSISTLPIT